MRGAISDSVVFGNDNAGVIVSSGGAASRVTVTNTVISGNTVGIHAAASAGVGIGSSTIAANTTGVQTVAPGTIQSFGTNKMYDNTTNGTFTPPALSQN